MNFSAWPQYIFGGLLSMQFVVFMVKDRAEPTVYDRSISVAASLFVIGGEVFLLWAGGFWAPMGAP